MRDECGVGYLKSTYFSMKFLETRRCPGESPYYDKTKGRLRL